MYRWIVVASASFAVLVAGCSTTKPVIPTPAASKPSSSANSSAPQTSSSPADSSPAEGSVEPLGGDACVEITQANLDLATATDAAAAKKAGDAFEKYDLPGPVKDAVEHFVGTGGAQFDDPDYDKYNNAIEGWIKQACPL
ncbi:MAG: hypothetical protein QOK02_678 [Mycobacterium sp.]|jgi:hypothetical protein|nr:hypothetical protein [Mycobacterium sp.]